MSNNERNIYDTFETFRRKYLVQCRPRTFSSPSGVFRRPVKVFPPIDRSTRRLPTSNIFTLCLNGIHTGALSLANICSAKRGLIGEPIVAEQKLLNIGSLRLTRNEFARRLAME